MHLIALEHSAKAQHETLCRMGNALRRHATRSSHVDNDEVRSFGVLISTPLDIDEKLPCDLERRFFVPSCKDEHLQHALGGDNPDFVTGLVETGATWEGVWAETYDHIDPDDSECLPLTPDQLPRFRFWWFARCLDDMQQVDLDGWEWWEDKAEEEQHRSRTDGWRNAFLLKTGDDTFRMPEREEMDWDYRPLSKMEPRDPAKSHFSVIMGDSKIASGPEEMLISELHAAVEFSKRQLTCGDFTNHHTKPIIIYTLMSETNARITQAHFDAKTNTLVVRQSRILDLKGKKPTPDAYLLLRWMLNLPVGETEYKQDEGQAVDGERPQRVPATMGLVAAEG